MTTKPLTLIFYRSGLRRRWRWRLVHRNGHKIASSAQGGGYSNRADAENAACLALSGADATIIGMGNPEVEGRGDIEVVFES